MSDISDAVKKLTDEGNIVVLKKDPTDRLTLPAEKESSEGLAKLSEGERKQAINKLSSIMVENGSPEKEAINFASALAKSINKSEYSDITLKFQDTKDMKSHLGITMESEGIDHKHNFAVIILNFGSYIIGVTTSTSKGKDHVHLINIELDHKILFIRARTDYSETNQDTDANDLHMHSFESDIELIRSSMPSAWVWKLFNEGKGKNKKKNSESSVVAYDDGKTKLYFSNQREAEVMLVEACSLTENEELQKSVYAEVKKAYPESRIFDDSWVAELADKKGSFVVPASQAKDKKDHFPIDTAGRARSALSRVAAFKKPPTWWSGSLPSLQKKIRSAVKKKYPFIKVKMSDHYAVRMKGEGDAFFIGFAATSLNDAKEDASIYARNCKAYRSDLVKFTVLENEETKFEDLGNFVFCDDNSKGMIEAGSEEIKLSERDAKGNVVIEILRTGNFNHEVYGRLDLGHEKLSEIITNFDNDVLDREISFDFNHESDLPASAWVRQLSLDRRNVKGNMQDILKAHVEFTARGEEAVKNGDYKYFSSEYVDVFTDKESGEEHGTTLKGGGLTNRPWIPGLKPVELSEKKDGIAFFTKTQ